MRILHCCLSCFYIDNYNYQENVLPRQNKIDGHDVMILASTETFIGNNKLGYISPAKYINEDGIEVNRISYRGVLPHKVIRKIRAYKNVEKYIEDFKPDVILFHGASAYDIVTVAKYKKKHPNVKIFVDSHEDFNNSARSFISKQILHRIFYKRFLKKALPQIEKVLNISIESLDFMRDFYEVPSSKLELFPLGGTIIDGDDYSIRRRLVRNELNLTDSDILLVHSGKMDRLKRTSDILRAFKEVPSDKLRLVLIGSIPQETELDLKPLIDEDERVQFLGWKSPEELHNYLCAADIYLQPGSQSATLQNAICCGCPIVIYPHKSHKPYLRDNGYYVETLEDMIDVFLDIDKNTGKLLTMTKASYDIAYELLDYKKLAARLYE